MLNTTRWMLVLLASVVLLTGCTREELPEADRDVEAPEQAALSYDSISGTRYYVDFVNGNDENTGLTPNEPWKHSPGDDNATGTAAMATLQPGDEIILKGGVIYRGTITLRDSGAPAAPIVIDGNSGHGFGEGKAIIDGSEPLMGWDRADFGSNVYVTNLPEGASLFSLNLYAGERKMSVAQSPTPSDFYAVDDYSEYFDIDPSGNVTTSSITDPTRFQALFAEHGLGNAHLAFWANDNRIVRTPILTYNATTGTITFEPVNSIYSDRDTNYYAIFNHRSALTEPGEYIVELSAEGSEQSGKVYVIPFEGEDPNDGHITYSVRPVGIDVRADYITVQNVIAQKHVGIEGGYHEGVGIRVYSNSTKRRGVTIRDNEVRYNSSYQKYGAIYSRNTHDLLVADNYVHHNYPNRGIHLTSGERTQARHNLIEGGGHTGLTVFRTTDGLLAHNVIRNLTATHANGISIYLGSHRNLVFGNLVRDGNIALTIKHSRHVTVAHNILHTDQDNYTVADWGGGAGNLRYLNNLILNAHRKGLHVNDSSLSGLEVRNNIIDGQVLRDTGSHISNNIYTSLGWPQNEDEFTAGNRLVEPHEIFIDYARGDYGIRKDAPLTPADDLDFKLDYNGNPLLAPFVGPYMPQ